jgi:uncharacterized protein YyaL (SSP411 family)
MNRLATEKSAYLKHAADQKIDWYPWCDEAFERARQEDKPVFLSTGAAWCHWCHVMAKESFYDEDVARLLNENFICVKLDRDERPDIDRRYQQAVAAMGNGSGWPLSVFLTPDRKPFFGGTYFPPEDSHGRPGFRKVLETIAGFYREKRGETEEYAGNLLDYIKPETARPGEIQKGLIENAEANILSEFDPQNGGFGSSPKFPMSGAIDFLINRYFLAGKEATGYAVRKTLESMAKGGFHDQLAGGFHRYSTDEAWIVPHFEKMADDNAWLLRGYVNGWSVFGDAYFREVAEGIISFVGEVLSDPEGGFYASQDADVTPDDEGGYFTWTREELQGSLTPEECDVISLHLFHEKGVMHHDPQKRVLFVAMEPDEIAKKTGMDQAAVKELLRSGRSKLLAERRKRETPFIDRTFYTSLNGLMITSFLLASGAFRDTKLRDFALKSLDRILTMRFDGKRLFHSDGVNAVLDDYISLTEALLSAYETTRKDAYLVKSEEMMGLCIDAFWDEDAGGFFDTEKEILGARLKTVEDVPQPSANAAGIMLLLKLCAISGKDEYRNRAEKALRAFSGRAGDMGLHAGYFFSAMSASFHLLMLTVEAPPGSELAETAVSFFSPYKSLVYGQDRGRVTPCLNGVCYEPVTDTKSLIDFLRRPGHVRFPRNSLP